MNAVILACSSMKTYLENAGKKLNLAYPVIYADRSLHAEPEKMKERLEQLLAELDEDIDTVLVAMGYCGGSWEKVPHRQRLVIPKVDDCITMFLHTDDTPAVNKKETGHMYICDKTSEDDHFSIPGIRRNLFEEYGEYNGDMMFKSWFAPYKDVDIIDTGCYDCYSEEFVAYAQESADLIFARLNYVEGSNIILEKLLRGDWDDQFLVIPADKEITWSVFFES